MLFLFRPGLGDEQLLEETNGEAVGHAGDEVPERGIESLLFDRACFEVLTRTLPKLLPQSRQDVRGLAELGCGNRVRSEEHTSELQSLRHLVCRLLLEKK